MKHLSILFLCLTATPCFAAEPASGNPFDAGAVGQYIGRFTSVLRDHVPAPEATEESEEAGKVILKLGDKYWRVVELEEMELWLKPDGKELSGTLEFKNKSYKAKASVKRNVLNGEFSDGLQNWPFSATMQMDPIWEHNLVLFTTAGYTNKLDHRVFNPTPGVWLSDRLEINLQPKDGKPAGTLKYQGRDFRFTGDLVADVIQGSFTNGAGSFPFTLKSDGAKNAELVVLTFESSAFSDELRSKVEYEFQRAWADAARRSAESTEVRPTFTNSLGMKFVPVTGTKLLFSIWETRIQDYDKFVKASERKWEIYREEGDERLPAVRVSWHDAKAFCAWLTDEERKTGRISPNARYRLPTDDEWDRAVGLPGGLNEAAGRRNRAPSIYVDLIPQEIFPWGTEWPPPEGTGNFKREDGLSSEERKAAFKGKDGFEKTAPVGSFKPNQFGLYDLAGNVAEWCEDVPMDAYRRPQDAERSTRGSAYDTFGFYKSDFLAGSRGDWKADGNRFHLRFNLGFRVLLDGQDAKP